MFGRGRYSWIDWLTAAGGPYWLAGSRLAVCGNKEFGCEGSCGAVHGGQGTAVGQACGVCDHVRARSTDSQSVRSGRRSAAGSELQGTGGHEQ